MSLKYTFVPAGETRRMAAMMAVAALTWAAPPAPRGGEAGAATLIRLADEARDQRRFDEAARYLNEALAQQERAYGRNSAQAAAVLKDLAWVYSYQDRADRAHEAIMDAMQRRQKAGADSTDGFADLLEEAAQIWQRIGSPWAAEKEMDRSLEIRETRHGARSPQFLSALDRCAAAARWWSHAGYARRLREREVALARSLHGAGSARYAQALAGLADAQNRDKKYAAASLAYAEAIAVARGPQGTKLDIGGWWAGLAEIEDKRNRIALAIECAEAALKAPGAEPDPDTHALLARLYEKRARTDEADVQLSRLRKLDEEALAVAAAEEMAEAAMARRDSARAVRLLEYVVIALDRQANEDSGRLVKCLHRLAMAYQMEGRFEDANQANLRATGLMFRDVKNGQSGALMLAGMAFALVVTFSLFGLVAGLFWIPYHFVRGKLERELDALEGAGAAAPPPADGESAAAFQEIFGGGPEPAAEMPAATAAEPQSISFGADGATLFRIRIMNLLLAVLTLGVYSFWGKARTRRYLCGQARYAGDCFVFHGTGGEMMRGWLRGLPFVAVIVLLPYVLPLAWQSPWAMAWAQWGAIGVLLLIWPVARAGAYRYRVNRMSWRGIRFSFRGSTPRFFGLSMGGYALIALTLGLYKPYFDHRVRRFFYSQTQIGDRQLHYAGQGSALLPCYLFAGPVTLFTFGLFWFWYSALRERYFWAHTTMGGARFRCTATGAGLLKLWSGNFLILVLTLGLGAPWAVVRTLRYWTANITWKGDAGLDEARQEERMAGATGEGFADFLGFDFGF